MDVEVVSGGKWEKDPQIEEHCIGGEWRQDGGEWCALGSDKEITARAERARDGDHWEAGAPSE